MDSAGKVHVVAAANCCTRLHYSNKESEIKVHKNMKLGRFAEKS